MERNKWEHAVLIGSLIGLVVLWALLSGCSDLQQRGVCRTIHYEKGDGTTVSIVLPGQEPGICNDVEATGNSGEVDKEVLEGHISE